MYTTVCDLCFYLIKPFITAILKKKKYPDDAIRYKFGDFDGVIDNDSNAVIMFHGVSVGEVNALENLIKETRSKFKTAKIIITTGTFTGQDVAKKKFKDIADLITYFPMDFPCVIKKFLDKLHPNYVFIAETEIWPNFAMECKKRNIDIYIINGRISDHTFSSYKFFKPIFRYFLSFYTGIYTQSDEDNEKFLDIGADINTTKRMNNLKFDIKKPIPDFNIEKGFSKLLLAGSTHKGEDEIILQTYKNLKEKHPDLKLLIAPRHLTRVNEVCSLTENFGLKYDLRSNGISDLSGIDVLILDTLGELGKLYAFADISFIGGSFNKTGGHNPLESIVFGVPVISGPSVHNFKDIYNIIKNANAGYIVKNEFELVNIINKLLSDEAFYKTTVNACSKVFEEQQGALKFVINLLEAKLSELDEFKQAD